MTFIHLSVSTWRYGTFIRNRRCWKVPIFMGMKTVFLTSHFVRWQVSESITGNAPLFFLIEKARLRHWPEHSMWRRPWMRFWSVSRSKDLTGKYADCSDIRLSMPCVTLRTSRWWKRTMKKTMLPTCSTYYISMYLSSTTSKMNWRSLSWCNPAKTPVCKR